mmetsp:Transcript_16885/g.23843  ORF Transcript_16885/g.23843 Transcript_16885/m.23843 type:complete len:257 (+) Transcript_16885:150-920(+)
MMNTLTKRLAQTCISKIVHNPSIPKHSLRTSLFLTGNKPFVLSTLPSNTTRCMSSSSSSSSDNTQHEEWVKFQQSIAVDGFNTGQTTQVNTNLTKRRGGKQLRKRNEKEMELQKREEDFASMGGGQFPTLRYSDEETERLLLQAYAAIPPKAGPRKSRHLKRQKVRWWRVRQLHRKKKQEKVAAHYKKMEKRSRIVREVKECKDVALTVRGEEREYQMEILRRSVLRMLELEGEGGGKLSMLGGGDGEKEDVLEKH